jgi:TolB-like protein/DNA-binding winged helix-turn-helix (wHTH) protein/Tfp pilus assembly protein PilF
LKAADLYQFGPFRLDPAQGLLFRGEEIVPLTPKAVETLAVLIEHRGEVVTKDALLQRIWPDTFVEEGTVARNVSFLRKALGEAPSGREYIETHAKRGYRFVAEVHEVRRAPSASVEPAPQSAAPLVSPAARSGRWWIAALVAAAVLLAIGVGTFNRLRAGHAAADRKVMLVVLPLENMSGDAEQEYFSSGLTEEMITQLGRLAPARLGVIARTSAMKFKGSRLDARRIGAELGVDYILEGSVRQAGGRVRIAAQLVQVSDQSHVWAEEYDRELRDILSVQSEVAGAIARQIRLKLTPERDAQLRRASPVNPEAYEDYLKGRFFWNKRTAEGHQRAIELFEQAIALDPDYAPAYAGLADSYALLGSNPNSLLPRQEAMARAREAALKALSFDESLADAHASLGFVKMHYDWDFKGAEKEFRRAIELDPGYATAHHWYAYDLVPLGRLDDAVAEVRRAQQADPLSVIISRDVGEMLLFAGRDDDAIAQCRRTLEMDPGFALARWVIAAAYHHEGRQKESLDELGKAAPSLSPAATGIVYALTGREAQARRVLDRLLASASKRYSVSNDVASLYACLGDEDAAFEWLERSFEERNGSLILMRVAPEYEWLRSDPRFERLAERVGLAPVRPSLRAPSSGDGGSSG